MSEETDSGTSRNDGSTDAQANRRFEVFVDKTKATFEDATVRARNLIAVVFPDNPDEYDLVALRGEGGPEDAVFAPDDSVHLDEAHRTHFDTKGDGRNYV